MKRGEVYWASLAPRSGSEQTGRRPVVVLSHDAFNQTPGWRSISVVPLSTSVKQARCGPTVAMLPAGSGGLPEASMALCHQVTTLDRSKLETRIGMLPADLLAEIEKSLLVAVDIRLR